MTSRVLYRPAALLMQLIFYFGTLFSGMGHLDSYCSGRYFLSKVAEDILRACNKVTMQGNDGGLLNPLTVP